MSLVNPERLRQFFHPERIALVGATDKSRWSLFTYMNMNNFGGINGATVYCVNPGRSEVHGQKAYASLRDIEEPVDLAYVMVGTNQVLHVLEDAHASNIRNIVILTSGFSEVGLEGARVEKAILDYAEAHDQVILGPNGNGFINVGANLAPYGLLVTPPLIPGPVGIVLQSGALASSVLTLSQARNVGLSLLVSMGNETMMAATDVMDYLIEDENTKVIAVFLESIRQPKEFERVAMKALHRGKPVVALKIGRSEHSARTAMAHTGALVGDHVVNDAALKRLGVIQVESLEDLITTAGLLGYTKPLLGRRMGVVTPSGGACDILSDRAQDEGLRLPEFAPQTVSALRDIVPSFSTVHNPLDVTGFVVVDGTLMRRALSVVTQDESFDFVLCLTDPPRVEPEDIQPVLDVYGALRAVVEESKVPVVLVTNTSVDITPFGRDILEQFNLHFVGGMEHGMTAIGNAVWWYERAREAAESWTEELVSATRIAGPSELAPGNWSEWEARKLLAQEGIPVVKGSLAATVNDAVAAARDMGYPVAMKVQSPDIAHKSDVGGVSLNLHTDEEVARAFHELMQRVAERAPGSRIDGVLVSPMKTSGIEMLVGIVRDPLWGPVMAVGLGGVYVEVFKDTSLRVLPVTRNDIRSMLSELKSSAILQGIRGGVRADLNQLVDVIYRTSQFAVSLGDQLQALEINPLWISGAQVEALDALISLRGKE